MKRILTVASALLLGLSPMAMAAGRLDPNDPNSVYGQEMAGQYTHSTRQSDDAYRRVPGPGPGPANVQRNVQRDQRQETWLNQRRNDQQVQRQQQRQERQDRQYRQDREDRRQSRWNDDHDRRNFGHAQGWIHQDRREARQDARHHHMPGRALRERELRRLPPPPRGQSYRYYDNRIIRVDNNTAEIIATLGLLSLLLNSN